MYNVPSDIRYWSITRTSYVPQNVYITSPAFYTVFFCLCSQSVTYFNITLHIISNFREQ